MTHVLHTVVVSYNRLELLKRTIESYVDTVTLPYTLCVVDNGSWPPPPVSNKPYSTTLLLENLYPGYAANLGFREAPDNATLYHRSDNDMEYLPGWCDEVVERFEANPNLGQLGLRTLEEEGNHAAVGGNAVIRRELWDKGLRYDERPWTQVPFEDANMSQKVRRLGYTWERVQKPCTVHIGIASSTDPYYQATFADRGITFAEWGVA